VLRGITCRIASTTLVECQPSQPAPPIVHPVKPDLLLADAKAADYDAIYFCGGVGCEELAGEGKHSAEVRRLIHDALSANRTVAAMGTGVVILAEADVLQGRKAACYPYGKPPGAYARRIERRGALCSDEPVAEDGLFLTGRAPQDMRLFSEALLKRLGVEPRPPPSPAKTDSP
jgi:putative intracellular protease/amidase